MKLEAQTAIMHRTDQSDYRDLLTAMFGLMSPDAGQVEWLLDRIERASEARKWA